MSAMNAGLPRKLGTILRKGMIRGYCGSCERVNREACFSITFFVRNCKQSLRAADCLTAGNRIFLF